MRTVWKILIAIVVVLAVLIAVNTIVVDQETKSASVTVDGRRILELPKGGQLQVTDTGPTRQGARRAPIVLLHCFGCSMRWWDRIMPALKRDHRVIRMDLLGFGGSEKPGGG